MVPNVILGANSKTKFFNSNPVIFNQFSMLGATSSKELLLHVPHVRDQYNSFFLPLPAPVDHRFLTASYCQSRQALKIFQKITELEFLKLILEYVEELEARNNAGISSTSLGVRKIGNYAKITIMCFKCVQNREMMYWEPLKNCLQSFPHTRIEFSGVNLCNCHRHHILKNIIHVTMMCL